MRLVAKFIIPFLLGNAYSVAQNALDEYVTAPRDEFQRENKKLPSENAMDRDDLTLEYSQNENSTNQRRFLSF